LHHSSQAGLLRVSPKLLAFTIGAAFFFCGVAAGAIPQTPGAAQYVNYVSNADGSTHTFALYLPDGYTPSGSFPLAIHGYGYGGSATLSFPATFANQHDWIMVNFDGRRQLQYDGVAELDLIQVLDLLESDLAVDATRVYFEGHSQGSTGAMRIGFHHPDRFAAVAGGAGFLDYNEWYERWYAAYSGTWKTAFSGPEWRRGPLEQDSAVHVAENGRHMPCYFTAGSLDTTNRPQGAIALDARLTALGYTHTFTLVPGAGHSAGYSQSNALNYFQSHNWTTNPYAPDIIYKTNQLKYNEAYWARIDRLQQHLQFATIDTAMNAAQQRINVATQNILQYTLKLTPALLAANGLNPAQPVSIYTNGFLSYTGPAGQITLYATLSGSEIVGWSTANNLPQCLAKTHALEGPVGHAFNRPFRVVYGTSGTAAANQQSEDEALYFVLDWNDPSYTAGNESAYEDTSIDLNNPPDENLVLFGTSDSNAVIDAVLNDPSLPFHLPLVLTDATIQLGDWTYDASQYGLFLIYPSPLKAGTYIVISHGYFRDHNSTAKNIGYDIQTLPWAWADYVIFRHNVPYDSATMRSVQGLFWPPSVVVKAGHLDGCWQLDDSTSSTPTPTTTGTKTPTPTRTPTSTRTATRTPTPRQSGGGCGGKVTSAGADSPATADLTLFVAVLLPTAFAAARWRRRGR